MTPNVGGGGELKRIFTLKNEKTTIFRGLS
jgi:hypothetical protein